MKLVSFSAIIILVLISFSCHDNTTPTDALRYFQQTGKVTLSFTQAPAGITRITAALTRQGFETLSLNLNISDSSQTANGTIENIHVGIWHLKVEALDSANISRYEGETEVTILPGETARIDLELVPSSGNLDIHVTWGSSPNLTLGLMLHYPFDGNTIDSSGNGNNGASNNPAYTTDHWGHENSAYLFNGVDNYITVPNSPSLNPSKQLTVTFWLRVDSIAANYMEILLKGGPAYGYFNNREYALYTKQHTSPYYYLELKSSGDSSGQHELNSGAHIPGEWIFITAIVDRIHHSMKFYENGMLTSQTDDTYSSFNVNSYPLIIGWSEETFDQHAPLRGAMDNLRIYNRVLSPEEIRLLYSSHE